MSSGPEMYVLVVVFVLFTIGSIIYHQRRGSSMLEKWAQNNGFTILSRERRYLRTGTYFFRHSKGQEIFYITVRYPDGRRRSGYVRVGGFFLGMLSDAVDVTWDD